MVVLDMVRLSVMSGDDTSLDYAEKMVFDRDKYIQASLKDDDPPWISIVMC